MNEKSMISKPKDRKIIETAQKIMDKTREYINMGDFQQNPMKKFKLKTRGTKIGGVQIIRISNFEDMLNLYKVIKKLNCEFYSVFEITCYNMKSDKIIKLQKAIEILEENKNE